MGIIIKEKDTVNLRHASSVKKHRKVIDEDLIKYLKSQAGNYSFETERIGLQLTVKKPVHG